MNFKLTSDHIFLNVPHGYKTYAEKGLGGVFSKREGMYKFPRNIHAMRELAYAFPELRNNGDFIAAGVQMKNAQHLWLQHKQATDSDVITDPRLRPYQRADIYYLQKLPSAGIFNEPRTGKTPTSILLMKRLGTKKNLIIAPASLIWNWAKEFEKWWPEAEVMVYAGTPAKRKEIYKKIHTSSQFILIVSKDMWKSSHESIKVEFDTCFVDEAHYLRNYKTAQSKAIYAIKAKRRYALTGTPTVKHAADIYGILHFLYPNKFNSYWQFVDRYFEVGNDHMGHVKVLGVKPERETELKELIGFASVQRKRKEVMQWLPDKERITFYCQMEGKQEKLYRQMEEEFIAVDDESEHSVDTQNILTQTMRMRQLCLDPKLLGFDAPSAKTDALIEWLEDNPGPVVIMSQFTSYLKMLAQELTLKNFKVGMIHGEMSNAEKQQSADAFQRGMVDTLLCNIISAGTGFTLDNASTILFTDKAWNPSDNQQAEDRITPTTQDRLHKHTIISFVCKDSFDERINDILEQKKSLTDIINEGGREAIAKLLRGS